MKFFFDLDGTLVDSRNRMYELFNELVPESSLDFDEYWELKRQRIDHEEILLKRLSCSRDRYEQFHVDWMSTIEDPQRLELDTPFPGVEERLRALQTNGHELFLVTSRQSRQGVMEQLARFGWQGIFEQVLVTGQQKEKQILIAASLKTGEKAWMISDTGSDIAAARALGLYTVAVTCGVSCPEILQEYQPDKMLASVAELEFES